LARFPGSHSVVPLVGPAGGAENWKSETPGSFLAIMFVWQFFRIFFSRSHGPKSRRTTRRATIPHAAGGWSPDGSFYGCGRNSGLIPPALLSSEHSLPVRVGEWRDAVYLVGRPIPDGRSRCFRCVRWEMAVIPQTCRQNRAARSNRPGLGPALLYAARLSISARHCFALIDGLPFSPLVGSTW